MVKATTIRVILSVTICYINQLDVKNAFLQEEVYMSQPWTLHIQIMFVYPTLYCDNLSALYMTVNLGPNMVTILLDKRWLEDNYLHI